MPPVIPGLNVASVQCRNKLATVACSFSIDCNKRFHLFQAVVAADAVAADTVVEADDAADAVDAITVATDSDVVAVDVVGDDSVDTVASWIVYCCL